MDRRQSMYIWQAGYFTIVHIPEVDVTVLWDRKTTIHIQAGPRWQVRQLAWDQLDLKSLNAEMKCTSLCHIRMKHERICMLLSVLTVFVET